MPFGMHTDCRFKRVPFINKTIRFLQFIKWTFIFSSTPSSSSSADGSGVCLWNLNIFTPQNCELIYRHTKWRFGQPFSQPRNVVNHTKTINNSLQVPTTCLPAWIIIKWNRNGIHYNARAANWRRAAAAAATTSGIRTGEWGMRSVVPSSSSKQAGGTRVRRSRILFCPCLLSRLTRGIYY